MFLAQWELVPGEPALRRRVPAGAVAALNTHDLPPFAAFWREHDAARTVPAAEARDILLEALGRSRASLVLVDAADLELAETPHNVPGTVGGGNWSRRSIRTIDELGADSGGQRSLARLDAARRRRGPAEPAATHGILLTDVDLHLLADGSHFDLHTKLGAHRHLEAGVAGTVFSVWAPDAGAVRVAGDWDGWADGTRLRPIAASGVWEAFVPGALPGHRYKLRLRTSDGAELEKADPLARRAELPPGNASVVDSTGHVWADAGWLAERPRRQAPGAPTSIYEVHLGSWRRTVPGGEPLGYREAARQLADHCNELGFTHVELLPVMEHPFTGSWGYQVTGFFAPTARYGTPDDFRWLVDHLHQRGLGVILDWVPAHFPDDPHGLARFDGSALYEHADPREGRHPDWGSLIFNYGRREVQSFLVSSAVYWLDEFHVDGLRVDAVASMLYRDYSRPAGEWIPNRYGGRENLEAIAFLRRASDEVRRRHPDVLFVAEESTSWPGVTAPTDVGGLGFTHKWDLGWMHDTLRYLSRDPVHRRWHQTDLTFRGLYHESERWVLPLSHDEVVHGKGSLLAKMPGDGWQQRASLRLLFGYQFGLPGAKLVFMGGELAQQREWDHDSSLDWRLLDDPGHAGVAAWLTALNRVYRSHASLVDEAASFRWIACDDAEHSVLVWRRSVGGDVTVWAANFTPVPRTGYRIGVPHAGAYREVLNSDSDLYGGGNVGNGGRITCTNEPSHGHAHSLTLTLPPLAFLLLKPE
jgi:1,4-alpha-glucan branching enzyme